MTGALAQLRQLKTTSLSRQARDAIRASIITGGIEAGKIYSVPALAERLGVSATPVREAMLELTNEGLVQPVRNRGFLVPRLSDHDLDELFELRLMLEVPSVGRAAGNITPQGAAECRALTAEIEAQAANGDLIGFLRADHLFHLRLLQELGNQRLVDIVGRLRDQVRLYGLPTLAESGLLIDSAREHAEILRAVEQGDRSRAEALMRRHVEHTRGAWAGLRDSEESEDEA